MCEKLATVNPTIPTNSLDGTTIENEKYIKIKVEMKYKIFVAIIYPLVVVRFLLVVSSMVYVP